MSDTAQPLLVLASGSPRRAEYLSMLGLDFRVDPAHVPEEFMEGESPREHVLRLARDKARAVAARHPGSLVLGGDTVVVLEGEVLGKPADEAEAVSMLLRLQGRTHVVATGLALIATDGAIHSAVETAEVRFRPFTEEEARQYVATGEPMDKAGAYGIQGLGAALVAGVEGDYYTVVGLPVVRLVDLLARARWRYTFGGLTPVP